MLVLVFVWVTTKKDHPLLRFNVMIPSNVDVWSLNKVDPSAAELSRCLRKMVTRRISAENWIRPGDHCRRKQLRRQAEFLVTCNCISVHQTLVCKSCTGHQNCKLLWNCRLILELLTIWEIISHPYTLTLNNVQTVDWYNNKPSTAWKTNYFTISTSQPNFSLISAKNCMAKKYTTRPISSKKINKPS